MELWEKKLRNAIRTEIRGLVNEGRLDLSAVAESLELDVSDLIAEEARGGEPDIHGPGDASEGLDEDDAKDWAEPNNPQGDGGQAEDSSGRGLASGPETATRVAEGDGDDDLDEKSDATGRSAEDSSGRGQASGPESATRVAEGDGDDDLDEDADAEDEIVAERWARLAGLIRG